jgi:hypothetical protein
LLLWLGACTTEPPDAAPAQTGPMSDAAVLHHDGDGDGLCDFTEDELGTNPDAVDSDADGLPDLIELLASFDATDPVEPAADQLGHLEARRDAGLDFPVRATVDGDGQGISGYFQSVTAIYADGSSAADFFKGAVAVSALPVDGVRSINEGSAYFAAVLGKTRLLFSLRFEYPFDLLGELECARVYPFRYAIKTDDGDTRAERVHLLAVTPPGDEVEHCLPRTCQ